MKSNSQPTTEQFDLGRAHALRRYAFGDPDGHDASRALVRLCGAYAAHSLARDRALSPLPEPESHPAPGDYPTAVVDPFELLRAESGLPSLPAVHAELGRVISNPQSSAEDVARVIRRDTGLAASLLRLVNSSFYSFPSQIETISRAVTLVGTTQLANLALGTTVLGMFREIPKELVNMETFWRHSIATGILAGNLARRRGERDPERLFVAGLLHDVGLLMMYRTIPDKSLLVQRFIRERGALLHQAEMNILGFDHAMLGGMMLRKWNLPYPLVNAVLRHHTPDRGERHMEPALIHVANVMAAAMDNGPTGEPFIQPLNLVAWEATGLSPEDLSPAARESEEQIAEVCQALFAD